MAENIEKSAILLKCEEMWNNADETTQTGVDTINAIDRITDFIESLPVTDVKRGHWYHNTSKYVSELDAYFVQACCSCCKRYSHKIDNYTGIMSNNYCSCCGADMRGENNG